MTNTLGGKVQKFIKGAVHADNLGKQQFKVPLCFPTCPTTIPIFMDKGRRAGMGIKVRQRFNFIYVVLLPYTPQIKMLVTWVLKAHL